MTSTFKIDDRAFRAIDEHRRAAKIFVEAVRVEFASEGKVTKDALARLNETTQEATDKCFAAGASLVKTQPTTMPGAIAMLRYLATLYDDEGTGCECSIMPDTIDTSDDEEEAWQVLAFRTLASALAQMPATAAEAQ
jgi:hypothetical protein